MALASFESSNEFIEQAFKNGNDVQILSTEKYILQSLEQLKIVKDKRSLVLPKLWCSSFLLRCRKQNTCC